MAPKVSILIPIYNISEFIPRCLESCINQTLKDIEIVCVNDGSTDDSLDVLSEYAKKDKRINVITKQNGGLPSARNAGLDAAKGEYVMFLDGDDWIELDACKKLYNLAKRIHASVVIFGGQVEPINKETSWTKSTLKPKNFLYKELQIDEFLSNPSMFPFLWRNFVKNSHIQNNGFRLDEKVNVGEDLAFQFKILPLAKNVVSYSRVFYHYDCSREGSLTNNKKYVSSEYKISKHLILVDSLWTDWSKRGLLDKYGGEFFSWAIDFIYWNFAETSTCLKNKLANELRAFFKERGIDKFKYDLNAAAKEEYGEIRKWSKFIKEEDKLITAVFNVGLNPDYLHFSAFIKSLEKYRSFLNVEIVMHYYRPLEYIKFEKLCFEYPNISFNLINEYEDFSSYDDIIKKTETKYITFINYENVLPLNNPNVCEALKSNIDLLVVDEEYENNPKKLFITPISNMIFNTNFVKTNNRFGNYGIFGDLLFKLQLIHLQPNSKFISDFSIPRYEGAKFTEQTPESFLHSLDGITRLIDLYKETNNRDYLQLARRLIENDDFVDSIKNVSFAWNEKSLPLVKGILKKIIDINDQEEFIKYYSVNRLLLNFVKSTHLHMAGLYKYEEKTKKQLLRAAFKI